VNPPYPGRLAMDLPWSEASPVLKNPFFHRGPVRDRRYFFGRTRETRQVLEMLCNGQCVSIVGPRRIGKTSHHSDVFFSPVFADFVQRQLTEKAGAGETHGQGTRKAQSIWRWLVRLFRIVGSALQSAGGKSQKSG
jgi:hypothetical protein